MVIMVIDMTTVNVQFIPVSQSVTSFNDVSAAEEKVLQFGHLQAVTILSWSSGKQWKEKRQTDARA